MKFFHRLNPKTISVIGIRGMGSKTGRDRNGEADWGGREGRDRPEGREGRD